MAPWTTIQIQDNSTLKIFQPAETVPKLKTIGNRNQCRNFLPVPHAFRCAQGRILGPLLYVLYTYDLPTSRETKLGTFANDPAIFATHEDASIASLSLQEHIHIVEK
jgi:hypothetical protein